MYWLRINCRWLIAALVVLGAFMAAIGSASATDRPAWCYDGDQWLGYAEGIPGSASQEKFTECLKTAVGRGEATRFDGMVSRTAFSSTLESGPCFGSSPRQGIRSST